MTGCTLELPYPPPLSACFTNVPKRGRVKTARYKAWEALAVARTVPRPPLIAGRVHVNITAIPPDNRERDGDNILKATFDFLKTRGVIEDDSNRYVRSHFMSWREKHEGEPGVRVEVKPYDG